MKELLDILNQAQELRDEGKQFAIATVVKIGGSTYRRPGARMLISEDGSKWGTISGGCLEGEVAQRAMDVIETGKPVLVPFDLEEDDIVLGFGTGCNGIVHVLIQPHLENTKPSLLEALNFCISNRRTSVMATVISAPVESSSILGSHLVLLDQDEIGPSTLPESLYDTLLPTSRQFLREELNRGQMYLWHTHSFETREGEIEVLFEIVRPPIHLHIFGEGHDVHAVLAQALLLGWHVSIIGRKPVEVLEDRFPHATSAQFLMHPEQVLDLISPDGRSAALVMNHTYVRDRDIMQVLLNSSMPYIGMLGPRERTEQMLSDLREKNQTPAAETLGKLFGPVGLDIGTETPEEIALSAIAEIQAILHRREGAPLRNRESPIHSTRVPIESI